MRDVKKLLVLVPVFVASNLCFAQQVKTKQSKSSVKLSIDSVLTISSGNQKLLTYQFKTV